MRGAVFLGFGAASLAIACAHSNPRYEKSPEVVQTEATVGLETTQASSVLPALKLSLSSRVFRTGLEPFRSHQGPGPFGSYLAMSIPFAPVAELFDDLKSQLGRALLNRGEAHVTVITPPEYAEILKSFISMDQIETLAAKMSLQASRFEVVCLGRGQATIDGRLEQTFFVVIRSEALIDLREEIAKAYVVAGGEPSRFDPRAYYPHITVGFTRSDLHESNGIKKGANSCVAPLPIRHH